MSAASGDNNALSLLACVLFVLGVVIVALAVARRRAGDRSTPRHRLDRDSGRTSHRRRRRLFRRTDEAAKQPTEPAVTLESAEPVGIFDEPPASVWAPPDQAGSCRRTGLARHRTRPGWAPSDDTGGTTRPAGPSGPAERAGPGSDADTLDLGGDLPTARLLVQADAALVAADNALCTSEQELAFAQAQHGRDATVGFVEAVTAARADLAEAFRIRQHLDDHEPEDEFSRRRVLRAIVEHCAAANQRLDARAEPFELLRSSEEARLGSRLTVRRDEARTRLTVAGTTWKELTAAYAESALRPIAENLAQAAARVDFASVEIEQDGRRAGLRTAQQALGQAETLLDALDTYAADLATAEDAAAELLADLHAEVAAGKAVLAMAGRPPGNARGDNVGLAADVTRADEAAAALATELAEARPDPVAGLRRLEAVSGPLGESLGRGPRPVVAGRARPRAARPGDVRRPRDDRRGGRVPGHPARRGRRPGPHPALRRPRRAGPGGRGHRGGAGGGAGRRPRGGVAGEPVTGRGAGRRGALVGTAGRGVRVRPAGRHHARPERERPALRQPLRRPRHQRPGPRGIARKGRDPC